MQAVGAAMPQHASALGTAPPRPDMPPHFNKLQDDFDKGTFHFLELYSAQRSMTDHNNSPEIKKFVEQVRGGGCGWLAGWVGRAERWAQC